jgi:hypothetical protein
LEPDSVAIAAVRWDVAREDLIEEAADRIIQIIRLGRGDHRRCRDKAGDKQCLEGLHVHSPVWPTFGAAWGLRIRDVLIPSIVQFSGGTPAAAWTPPLGE